MASDRHFRETEEIPGEVVIPLCFAGARIVLDRIKWHVGVRWGRCSGSTKRHIVPTLAQPKAVQALSYNLAQARTSPSEHAMQPAPRTVIGCGVPPRNSRYLTCLHDNGSAIMPLE